MFTTQRNTAAPKSGAVPDDIAEALERFRQRLDGFVTSVSWHAEVGSTNDVAQTLAEQGGREGTLVGSDMQTAGRGRQGRVWVSPPGAGLYVSMVLRPPDRVAPLLTIAAGVALAEGIREATGLHVCLKWPNDVFVERRKLAGILAEAGVSPAGVNYVVLGFGINLLPALHPPDVALRSTSLEHELGRGVERGLVLAACLAALALRYRQLTGGRSAAVVSAWRTHAAPMLGRRVECAVGLRMIAGVAEDIDDAGALLVRTGDEVVRIISGEVLWL